MKKNVLLLTIFTIAFIFMGSKIQNNEPYKDPAVPVEERIEDLLKRLTLEEKIDLLGGTGFASKPLERLGIPELRMADGPLGVRWEKSTAFPSGIAMGATWNPELIRELGAALGRETKAKDRHVILGPCVNITRIPQGGRNFESFGEDPFLTSRITVDYIKGVQSENVVATVKHFACNNQEHERMYVDTRVDERTLHEIYLPAFKAAVQEADVLALMNAYNKVNGHYCSENDYLLIDVLKKQWGFTGLVMSDWGAVHSSIPTANSGCDLEMPDGKYLNRETLLEAVKNSTVKQSAIDDKIRRLLRVLFKTGLFEKPDQSDKNLLGTQQNTEIAYRTEAEGIVLLKNEKNFLPMDFSRMKSLAVIGPNTFTARTGGGGSSKVDPLNAPSPADIFKKNLEGKVKLSFAAGVKMPGDTDPIPAKFLYVDENTKGVKGEYYDNAELKGNPAFVRTDQEIDFKWGDGGPKEDFKKDGFSVRWTGKIKAPKSGEFTIETTSDDGVRLYINDKLVLENWDDHAPEPDKAFIKMEKDKLYDFRMEFYENGGGAVAKLGWQLPDSDILTEAVQMAKNSDAVILFVGNSENIESEGFDRQEIGLPADQDKLIEAVTKVNKNVVVVITTGSPVTMNKWVGKVGGIIEAWFGGQEMSRAIYDVMTGKVNPSGKLPVSFPVKWEDCSAYGLYKAKDSVTVYSDGIYVGYRHFDKKKIEPLFPFGFGLSYTKFSYDGLKLSKDGDKVKAVFTLKNTGDKEGMEVAQVYVKDPSAKVDRPEKELKGFKKVNLKPGESKTVEIILDSEAFKYYDSSEHKWVLEPGEFQILVGGSSRDLPMKGTVVL